jgi:hypothetical protein
MKGQFTFDYLIALILFVTFVIYLAFRLLQFSPVYINEVNEQRLRAEAYQISEILVNDPGQPVYWNSTTPINQIKRVGLSDQTKNKTNLLSLTKISSLQTLCNQPNGYTNIKSWLGTEFQFSINLTKSDGTKLINCTSPQAASLLKVDVKRIVAFDSSYGNLSIQVW